MPGGFRGAENRGSDSPQASSSRSSLSRDGCSENVLPSLPTGETLKDLVDCSTPTSRKDSPPSSRAFSSFSSLDTPRESPVRFASLGPSPDLSVLVRRESSRAARLRSHSLSKSCTMLRVDPVAAGVRRRRSPSCDSSNTSPDKKRRRLGSVHGHSVAGSPSRGALLGFGDGREVAFTREQAQEHEPGPDDSFPQFLDSDQAEPLVGVDDVIDFVEVQVDSKEELAATVEAHSSPPQSPEADGPITFGVDGPLVGGETEAALPSPPDCTYPNPDDPLTEPETQTDAKIEERPASRSLSHSPCASMQVGTPSHPVLHDDNCSQTRPPQYAEGSISDAHHNNSPIPHSDSASHEQSAGGTGSRHAGTTLEGNALPSSSVPKATQSLRRRFKSGKLFAGRPLTPPILSQAPYARSSPTLLSTGPTLKDTTKTVLDEFETSQLQLLTQAPYAYPSQETTSSPSH